MNEFSIIKKYLLPLAKNAQGALSLTDDAAILKTPKGYEQIITKDAIVAGVHFFGDEPADKIAQKLLRVNLSDLAAMGATPYSYFLALMLPKTTSENWIKSFAKGLEESQKDFAITLMGGDTTSSPTLAFSITAIGLVKSGKALKRSGAKIGDDIFVSGTIGDSALGLYAIKNKLKNPYLISRYLIPQPRISLGQELQGIANSCMDISDGLMQDLSHITNASGVGAEINWQDIPLSSAAKKLLPRLKNPYEIIAAGGDDYELLFTVPAKFSSKLQKISNKLSLPITKIGKITSNKQVLLLDNGDKINLSIKGYNHFR